MEKKTDYKAAEKRYKAAEKDFNIQSSRWDKTLRNSIDVLDDAIDLLRSVEKIPAKHEARIAAISNSRMRIVENEISRAKRFEIPQNVKDVASVALEAVEKIPTDRIAHAGRKVFGIGAAFAGICAAAVAGKRNRASIDDSRDILKTIRSIAEEEAKIRDKNAKLIKKITEVESASVRLKKVTKKAEKVGGKKYNLFTKRRIIELILHAENLADKMN